MYCWAIVAQISLTDVSPVILFRGGSVCLSWLLETSLSIKKPSLCYLFWHHVKKTTSLSSDSLVLQHQKDVCCCIYHQAFFFSSLWGICFHWLVLLFSDSFFGNKNLWKPALVDFATAASRGLWSISEPLCRSIHWYLGLFHLKL